MNFPTPLYISGPQFFRPDDSPDGIMPWGPPEFYAPIPGDSSEYILRQQFGCLRSYFNPMPLNSPYGNFSQNQPLVKDPQFGDFILVGESEPKEVEGGVCIWWRTYAKLPPQSSQPTTFAYNFIGWGGTTLVAGFAAVNPRVRFQQTVQAEIVSDFFVIGAAAGISPFPYAIYPTIFDVPVLEAQKYLSASNAAAGLTTVGESPVDLLISDSSAAVERTSPSLEQYIAWTGVDTSQDPPAQIPKTKIIAQDSSLERWSAAPSGNIIERKTIKIIPI